MNTKRIEHTDKCSNRNEWKPRALDAETLKKERLNKDLIEAERLELELIGA